MKYVIELNPVRIERRRRGWTIGELAERAGVGRGKIDCLETGKTKDAGVRVLMAVSDAFGVSWSRLAGDWVDWRDMADRVEPADVVMAIRQEREEQ